MGKLSNGKMIIALTGKSNVGKTHIAELLSRECKYKHLSFSHLLKKMFPFNGLSEREPYKGFDSYKHYLAYMANTVNIEDPYLFTNYLIEKIEDDNYVIDDLRTPLQYRGLYSTIEDTDQKLMIVRVISDKGFSVSWMDDFDISCHGSIINDDLSDPEILSEIAKIIHTHL